MARDLERPLYRDQRPWFEIWFAVVIDADRQRAAWVRQTLFVPKTGDSRATVWAAWFDAAATPPSRAHKRIFPVSAVKAGPAGGDTLVQHGDCLIGKTRASGAIGDLGWRLEWSGGHAEPDVVPSWIPAPTHAHALIHDADATGEVTLGGTAVPLRGRAVLMHLWGRKRVPTLHWIWAPFLGDGSLEMTAVSLEDRFALGMASLRVAAPTSSIKGRPATAAHTNGLVTATIAGARRLVHARAWAEPEAMVGYVYRDTDGRDLQIAQSDAGSAHLETWTRTAPGTPWHPEDERRSAGGVAVEIHQREPLPGVHYLAWDAVERPALRANQVAVVPPTADEVEWPEVRSVVALGLTYRGHAEESGSAISPEPTCFAKHLRTVAIGVAGATVVVPDALEVRAAADALEPGLGAILADRLPRAPAVMDYEGELALVALGDIDDAALLTGAPQPFGLAAANDLTARLVQVLGDGQPVPTAYWAVAKSFPKFLPLAPRVWAPDGGIAKLPELIVETKVNGDLRQRASTTELVYILPAIVRAARIQLGRPLTRGDVILTGTPAGIGARLSPFKRRLAKRITDRLRKAELLVSTYAGSSSLLRPGDVVEVSVGRAGTVRTRLVV